MCKQATTSIECRKLDSVRLGSQVLMCRSTRGRRPMPCQQLVVGLSGFLPALSSIDSGCQTNVWSVADDKNEGFVAEDF